MCSLLRQLLMFQKTSITSSLKGIFFGQSRVFFFELFSWSNVSQCRHVLVLRAHSLSRRLLQLFQSTIRLDIPFLILYRLDLYQHHYPPNSHCWESVHLFFGSYPTRCVCRDVFYYSIEPRVKSCLKAKGKSKENISLKIGSRIVVGGVERNKKLCALSLSLLCVCVCVDILFHFSLSSTLTLTTGLFDQRDYVCSLQTDFDWPRVCSRIQYSLSFYFGNKLLDRLNINPLRFDPSFSPPPFTPYSYPRIALNDPLWLEIVPFILFHFYFIWTEKKWNEIDRK